MTKPKTYNLKTVVAYAVGVSLGFTLLAYLLSPLLTQFRATLLPDQGADWYVWKLPSPALWASISMWALYAAHQGLVWWLIFRLKKQPALPAGQAGRINIWLLVVNTVFVALHQVQTVLFYDALAQFVPVMSSQGSVIIMLVMILLMLNRRRGLFFGKKAKLPELRDKACDKGRYKQMS